jgi:hypothetical protein
LQVVWDSKTGFSMSGVLNMVRIFAEPAVLEPGQTAEFPTLAAGKHTTLCISTDTGIQGIVNITAGCPVRIL